MTANGRQEAYVEERVRKGAILGQVWGIDKRKFRKDWGRRLFDRLVWSVVCYGVEI